MLIINTAEGGTDGTTVATTNSSGDSGQAWNVVTIGATATATFSSTQAVRGGLSYHLTTTSTGSNVFLEWNGTSITQSGKTMYARMYCYFPSTPGLMSRIFEFTDSAVNLIGGIGVASSKFTTKDAAGNTIQTSVTSVPVNQWVRIEMKVFSDAAAGQVEAKIFLNPFSTTPDEVMTSSANQNTRGTDIIIAIFGNVGGYASYDMYYDEMAVQETGYIGVDPYLSPYRENTAEGQPSGTALTRANSGGSSGTPFDIVSTTGGGTITFSNAQSMHGSQSYLVSAPAAADSCVLVYNNRVNDTAAAYRFYIFITSGTSATTDIAYTRSSTGAVSKVQLTSTNTLLVANAAGTGIKTFTTALSLNTWYRIEQQCIVGTTTSNGTISTQYFLGDSLTPVDSYTSTATNTGTINIMDCRFGELSNVQGNITAYYDDIAFVNGNNYPIGPSTTRTPVSWIAESAPAPTILTGAGYSTSSNSTGSLTVALNKPSSLADGDYMLACIAHQQTGGTFTPPSGWTLVSSSNASGLQGIFYKYIPSAAAESATSYTWTISGSGRYVADLVTVRGANKTTFIDANGTWAANGANSVVVNSVTTTAPNVTLVSFVANYLSSTTVATITVPTFLWVQATQQNSPTSANSTDSQIAYINLTGLGYGAIGNQTFTFSTAVVAGGGIMFAIKPLGIS